MTAARRTTHDPSSVSARMETAVVESAVATVLLIGSASFVAMAVGDPELVAVVACLGIAVVLLGLAILSVSNYLGDDVPRS